MYSKKHLSVPLALSLCAFSQGSYAVTNIDTCRTIASSGSFRVTTNLTTNGDCLVIQANDVSIDLQGHRLRGNGTGIGVQIEGPTERRGIEIRNGAVTNFNTGINLVFVKGAVVERVRALQNNTGIVIGPGSVVSESIASENQGAGIFATIANNTGGGVFGGLITDNVAVENGLGIFSSNPGMTIRGNSVRANSFGGIEVSCPSTVIANSATDNAVNLKLNGAACEDSQNAIAN